MKFTCIKISTIEFIKNINEIYLCVMYEIFRKKNRMARSTHENANFILEAWLIPATCYRGITPVWDQNQNQISIK